MAVVISLNRFMAVDDTVTAQHKSQVTQVTAAPASAGEARRPTSGSRRRKEEEATQCLSAPAPKEQMQGVRGGEHLRAPAPKEPMQGLCLALTASLSVFVSVLLWHEMYTLQCASTSSYVCKCLCSLCRGGRREACDRRDPS